MKQEWRIIAERIWTSMKINLEITKYHLIIIQLALSRMISTWDQFKLPKDDNLRIDDVEKLLLAINGNKK
jgi:hypothetical protein